MSDLRGWSERASGTEDESAGAGIVVYVKDYVHGRMSNELGGLVCY